MRVSVIIPSNRYDYIQEALVSLKDQSVQPFEILYLYNPSIGPAEKVNALASIATGDVLLFLCDDDKLDTRYIEKCLHEMENRNVDIVYTDLEYFDRMDGVLLAQAWNGQAFRLSTVPFITSMVKKHVFHDVGGWDKDQIYQDYDFWYRCYKHGATAFHLEEPLFKYRVHANNLTSQVPDAHARDLVLNKHPELK